MKPRAISFSPPMVRANFAGRKTQTRRVARARSRDSLLTMEGDTMMWADSYIMDPSNREWLMRDAPAKPGQLLYMTEAWGTGIAYDRIKPANLAAGTPILFLADESLPGRYRPAMHLPMRFTRATLHVEDVRIERLKDISEADAIAEGLQFEEATGRWGISGICGDLDPVVAYRRLFEHINGPESWDANPLVWVISYRFEAAPITQVLERLAAA